MKISLEDARYLSDEEDTDDFKFVENGEWEDDGKYSSQYTIIESNGKFYQFWVYRSGSYFSHYEYEFYEDKEGMIEVHEVEKRTRVEEYWADVNAKKEPSVGI